MPAHLMKTRPLCDWADYRLSEALRNPAFKVLAREELALRTGDLQSCIDAEQARIARVDTDLLDVDLGENVRTALLAEKAQMQTHLTRMQDRIGDLDAEEIATRSLD